MREREKAYRAQFDGEKHYYSCGLNLTLLSLRKEEDRKENLVKKMFIQ